MTILIIEDNEIHLYALQKLLEGQGYEVRSAGTGSQGLEMARQEELALILLDVNLPDIDGIEVCQRLKAAPETSLTPIVIYSSHEGASLEAKMSGADAFLTYPIVSRDLIHVLNGTLKRATKSSQG
jgi:CheY-like chemotaxis protein